MTAFRPKLNGISLSDAIAEAAVVNPAGVVVLRTYEIRNYFLQTPIRLVSSNQDLSARLETAAPVDGGKVVTFYSCAVTVALAPESASEGSPEIDITITNVNDEIGGLLGMSRGSWESWEITERLYVSTDLESPAKLPPMTLTLTSVSMNGKSANIKAAFGDAINLAVPRLTYTVKEYPGLEQ